MNLVNEKLLLSLADVWKLRAYFHNSCAFLSWVYLKTYEVKLLVFEFQ